MKIAVLAAVFVAVSGTFRHALDRLAEHPWQMRVGWLVAAGVLYIAAMVPMAWFWWRVLLALGQQANWPAALRAYFLGHLGKYVPGKALVLVIRIGALRPGVTSVRLGLSSVLVETLTMMAVGGALAAAISAFTVGADSRLSLFAILVAIGCGVPTIPPIARRLGRKAAAEVRVMNEALPMGVLTSPAVQRGMTFRLMAAGWLASVLCWVLLGWSLWATLRGIGVEDVRPFADLPLMILVVALAVVAGFVSMLPGGLGVRDALLMQLLSPVCGEADALVAAVLVRLVWLLSELGFCVILEVAKRARSKGLNS